VVTYVIAEPCIDVMDLSCVDECPVDCIYVGARSLYIHPDECVDCGACEPACPVEAIYYEEDLPDQWQVYTADNAAFFAATLPGRAAPLGSPGGEPGSAIWGWTPRWSPVTHPGRRRRNGREPLVRSAPAGQDLRRQLRGFSEGFSRKLEIR
jgi:NAD-dependent dihydropyrimidine dehydrogenase PreA subunit